MRFEARRTDLGHGQRARCRIFIERLVFILSPISYIMLTTKWKSETGSVDMPDRLS
jgi:hypothetical protein